MCPTRGTYSSELRASKFRVRLEARFDGLVLVIPVLVRILILLIYEPDRLGDDVRRHRREKAKEPSSKRVISRKHAGT